MQTKKVLMMVMLLFFCAIVSVYACGPCCGGGKGETKPIVEETVPENT